MAPKTKKNSDLMNAKLALAIKSGKYTLGYKSTIKSIRQGKAKMIIIAANTPVLRGSLNWNTMLCYPRLLSTTSKVVTTN
ncbi:unnamed protein product [Pichia kudriavzevii]